MKLYVALLMCLLAGAVCAEVYFEDTFSDGDAWESRWVKSGNKVAEGTDGDFTLSAGQFFDDESNKGIKTGPDARFFEFSAEGKEFSNKDKNLVLQFSVKHEQNIDCGGAYVKLLPAGLDQATFNGDSEYAIMFGPDICGSSTKRTHVIFNYNGDNHLINDEIRCESDALTHLYTLIVKPDNTYQVLIDNEERRAGNLADDWDFLPAKEIKDPAQSKPADWVDEKEIDDPEAEKPAGWDDIPAEIVDPEAEKPEDWDDDLDGEWEAPTIDNPDYQGEWHAPRIANPAYQGEWEHPLIANPAYAPDDELYLFESLKYVGIEVWQVKAGTIFDNFLVTDDIDLASERAETVLAAAAVEKEAKAAHDAEEAERRRVEMEARAAEEGDDDIDFGDDIDFEALMNDAVASEEEADLQEEL